MNRTTPQNRLSVGSSAANAYKMQSSRTHSHSLSVGSINPAHRVTRRKSTSASAANQAAAIAAIGRDAAGNAFESGSYSSKRGKSGFGSKSPFPASLPNGSGFGQAVYDTKYGSAIADGPSLEALPEMEIVNTKARSRRASDGSQLRKGDSKRDKGGELKCETCGKGYKHSSCLTKHLLVSLCLHLPHTFTLRTVEHP